MGQRFKGFLAAGPFFMHASLVTFDNTIDTTQNNLKQQHMNKADFEAAAKKRKMKLVKFSLTENDEDEELLGRGKIEKGRATLKKGKKEIKIEWEWRHTENNYECVAREGYDNFTIEEHVFPDADGIFETIGY